VHDDKKLERLDPESEACFKTLVEAIAEELGARVAFGMILEHPKAAAILPNSSPTAY
jgi:hypothetical protein